MDMAERQHVVVNAEAVGIFGSKIHAHVVGEPNRHQIARMLDGKAQRVAPAFAFIVCGFQTWPLLIWFRSDRREPADGRVAVVHRRGVDEGA